MKAFIKPLEGKYYGTKIWIKGIGDVTVWLTFQGKTGGEGYMPSIRELMKAGITRDDWENNSLVAHTNCFGEAEAIPAKELVEACDHFEDMLSYKVASIMCDALNNFGDSSYES